MRVNVIKKKNVVFVVVVVVFVVVVVVVVAVVVVVVVEISAPGSSLAMKQVRPQANSVKTCPLSTENKIFFVYGAHHRADHSATASGMVAGTCGLGVFFLGRQVWIFKLGVSCLMRSKSMGNWGIGFRDTSGRCQTKTAAITCVPEMWQKGQFNHRFCQPSTAFGGISSDGLF